MKINVTLVEPQAKYVALELDLLTAGALRKLLRDRAVTNLSGVELEALGELRRSFDLLTLNTVF